MTKNELISQEDQIRAHWEAGDIPYLCHLMGGNEDELIAIFSQINPEDFVFASHRCHYHYSLHGGTDLVRKVLDGKSMFLYKENFICSAIVAGICSMACGVALGYKLHGSPRKVWAFIGDGATDEGSFWEALRFAEGWDLPITFVIEDNGGQCGVSQENRWKKGWPMIERLMDSRKVRYFSYRPTHPHAGCLNPDGTPTRPPIKWPG